jgi:hypothetical protein
MKKCTIWVDILIIHVVDQKWFSAFAKIGRTDEMVTSQEICAVSWGGLFSNFFDTSNKKIMSALPQTTGNAFINCINDHA